MAWQEHVGDWINPDWEAGPGVPGTPGTADSIMVKPSGTFAFRVLLMSTVAAERAYGAAKTVTNNAESAAITPGTTQNHGGVCQRHTTGDGHLDAVAGTLARGFLTSGAVADKHEVCPVQVYGFFHDALLDTDVTSDVMLRPENGEDHWLAVATIATGATNIPTFIKTVALEADASSYGDIFHLI